MPETARAILAFSFWLKLRRFDAEQTSPMPSSENVLTLDDLSTWSRSGHSLAVIGHPIKHSISPAMHNAALAELVKSDPRFADWKYVRFDIPPEQLADALRLFHAKGFHGLNLTVPHKVIAYNELNLTMSATQPDSLAATHIVERAAQPIGAVNTLLRTTSGWHGHNTDGYGLATAVKESLGRDLSDSHVILLGAGGAARGAAVECLQHACASLWIANRTKLNLDALLIDLAPLAGKIPLHGFDPQEPPTGLPADALVINATSAGMKPDDALPIDLAKLPRPSGVYDMIYNPPETRLLAQARALGLPAANGLSMLVHQGAKALEIWAGVSVPVEAMRTAAQAALGQHPS
jgi:shikimate dehydrogenase